MRVVVMALVLCVAACSRPAPATPTAKPACVVGKFSSAFEDDGHGVMVHFSEARTSATGYQPAKELQFYVHDRGNPTRGVKVGDDMWLVQNDPKAPFPWLHLSAADAKTRCPPM